MNKLHFYKGILRNTIIFNRLVEEGDVLAIWRMANLSPIFKVAKGDPSNYRPVLLTCVMGKVMESLIKDKMVEHMEKHNLIRPLQQGFMAGRSTAPTCLCTWRP